MEMCQLLNDVHNLLSHLRQRVLDEHKKAGHSINFAEMRDTEFYANKIKEVMTKLDAALEQIQQNNTNADLPKPKAQNVIGPDLEREKRILERLARIKFSQITGRSPVDRD